MGRTKEEEEVSEPWMKNRAKEASKEEEEVEQNADPSTTT